MSKDTPCGACAPAEDVRGEPFFRRRCLRGRPCGACGACGRCQPDEPIGEVDQLFIGQGIEHIGNLGAALSALHFLEPSICKTLLFYDITGDGGHPVGHLRSTLSLDRRGREFGDRLAQDVEEPGLVGVQPDACASACGCRDDDTGGNRVAVVIGSELHDLEPAAEGRAGQRILRVLDGCRDDPVLIPFDRDLCVIRAR